MKMEFSAVRPRRAVDQAVAQIASAVRMGELGAGKRLPSERDLSAQMQISRVTVREALRLLSEEGIVELGGNGAIVVTEVIPRRLVYTGRQLREAEVQDVLEARRLFEPRVAQLAAVSGEENDFDAMAETIQQQRQVVKSGLASTEHRELYLQLDVRFHLLIARATHNNTVVSMMQSLIQDVELAWTFMGEPSSADPGDMNERTLAAIRSRKLELVDQVMDEHLAGLERIWEEVSGRALLRPVPDFLRTFASHAAT